MKERLNGNIKDLLLGAMFAILLTLAGLQMQSLAGEVRETRQAVQHLTSRIGVLETIITPPRSRSTTGGVE